LKKREAHKGNQHPPDEVNRLKSQTPFPSRSSEREHLNLQSAPVLRIPSL
jgi:hypothetical protein